MRKPIDIHEFDKRLSRAMNLVNKVNPISEQNAELIRQFQEQCITEGLSKSRITKYVYTMHTLAELLQEDFDKASKEDIELLVNKIEKRDISAWTKHDYKVAIKKFYKWLKGHGEKYPPEVSWIKTTLKQKDALLPDEILTEDEIRRLVDAADSPRDKAFIISLYESGARIGELGSMQIRDVEFEERYTSLKLKGKTGSRRVIVVAATPYLNVWIQNHPDRDEPSSPLWVNMGSVNRYKAMSYPALAKILKVATRRAKLRKRVTPHLLRHSRATFLASRLTEAQMNQIFGWKQGSEMPSIYVHLSGRDLDDAILGVYGLKKSEEEQPKLTPKICPRCNQSNPYDGKFCSRCGLALDINAATQIDEARKQTDNIMDILLKDKEFRTLLREKIDELTLRTHSNKNG
jgi:site-specific recombinase XerD/ribosomal protein L40E